MTFTDYITITVGIIAIITTAIGVGVRVGLRRAEAKRLVRVEQGFEDLKRKLGDCEMELDKRIDHYTEVSDNKFARKDVVEVELKYIRNKLDETLGEVKEMRSMMGRRRKDDL